MTCFGDKVPIPHALIPVHSFPCDLQVVLSVVHHLSSWSNIICDVEICDSPPNHYNYIFKNIIIWQKYRNKNDEFETYGF